MLGINLFRNIRYFSTSYCLRLDMSWRTLKKLPLNPMDRGVLTDGADYIFLDGRPTPFGMKQKRKLLLQREYAKKIVQLSESLDIAKERYAMKVGEEEEKIKHVLDRKLRPKGNKNTQDK
ncbi:large ribosomal subunit protein mL52 [Metopolophium dirhodum]|uniref:large ribosomal subunit protein mL52 n=1 Tax=Metopolophium dirhodum TaxID=44670 RepID=UPI0029906D5B|nr:large ribosomal subunit protein mL52 [Metopolophium dirhodum]